MSAVFSGHGNGQELLKVKPCVYQACDLIKSRLFSTLCNDKISNKIIRLYVLTDRPVALEALTRPQSSLLSLFLEDKLLRHITMVAKFLDISKQWSCKYVRENETKKNDVDDFPVHDCT